jgi:hypothetical protein
MVNKLTDKRIMFNRLLWQVNLESKFIGKKQMEGPPTRVGIEYRMEETIDRGHRDSIPAGDQPGSAFGVNRRDADEEERVLAYHLTLQFGQQGKCG